VFAGGWSLDAAETVCETDLETIGSLVDKSLVRVDAERYAFLETIREFAAERLVESGEVELVRGRHAANYLALAEELEPKLLGSDQATSLDLLEAEHDNLRQALAWFAGQPEHELELRLAIALGRFRYVRGYLVEGRDGIEHALERGRNSVPVQLRAKALRAESTFAIIQGEYVEAKKLARAGLQLSRAAGDDPGVIRSLSNLGAILDGLGEIDAAFEALEEAVSLSRQQGDSRSVALAVNNLGDVLMSAGDYERAAGLFEESLALLRELGDSANVARALYNAAVAAIGLGEGPAAAKQLRESLPLSLEIGDREDAIWCLIAFAALAARDARHEHATRLLAAAEARLEEFGGSMKPFERGLYDRTLAATRDALPAETFAAAWSHGSDLSLDEAAESAMSLA
jgi:tetratricopeptide (TPR) repeat protein